MDVSWVDRWIFLTEATNTVKPERLVSVVNGNMVNAAFTAIQPGRAEAGVEGAVGYARGLEARLRHSTWG
jgi:hypothetical protein